MHRRVLKIITAVIIIALICLLKKSVVYAMTEIENSSYSDSEQAMLEKLELEEIDGMLSDLFENDYSFSELVQALLQGRDILELEKVSAAQLIVSILADTFQKNKGAMLSILLLGILSTVFSNISDAFESRGSAQVSFYIISLLLACILLRAMQETYTLSAGVLSDIILFMQTLIPTFIGTTAFVAGEGSAAVFYASSMLAIWLVETMLKQIVLPLTEIYIMLSFVNHILQEDLFLQVMDLIQTFIQFLIKTVLGVIIGIQTIQGLLAPAWHTLKASAVHKAISAIPGAGPGINLVTQTIISTAIVIKNSVGIAGIITLLFITLSPVLELFAILAMYKITAALLGIISEKRLSALVFHMGEGITLILKTVIAALVLFMISIALLSAFTNKGF